MKSKKFLSISSCIIGVGLTTAPLCSCSSKSINCENKTNSQDLKNIKLEKSNPKEKYGIDKAIKVGEKIFQNVFRPRTENGKRNIETIEQGAFQGNKQLQYVASNYESSTGEVALKTIDKGAFQACSNLEAVEIPANCTEIKTRAFFRCSKLSYIDFSAFEDIDSFETLCNNVGTDAFLGIAEEGDILLSTDLINAAKASSSIRERLATATEKLVVAGIPEGFFSQDNVVKKWNWDSDPNKETEQWNKLIEIAEQGSDKLKEYYGGTVSLIGKEAYVTVNSLQHKVRIIGIDHDDIVDETTNKLNGNKAALTFEFENVITFKKDNEYLELATDFENYASNYIESDKYLALESSENISYSQAPEGFASPIFSILPQYIKNNSQTVCKNDDYYRYGNYLLKNYTCKLFNPEAQEIGYGDSNNPVVPYEFYQTSDSNSRIKSLAVSNSVNSYHTSSRRCQAGSYGHSSSSEITISNVGNFFFKTNGELYITGNVGFAPCFCIGSTQQSFKSINVKTNPNNVQFFYGDEFNSGGLVIEATKQDDTKINLYSADFEFNGSELKNGDTLSNIGNSQTVTVKYGNLSTSYTIDVLDKLTSIAVTPPTKTTYQVGEKLDLSGMKVVATLNDGDKEKTETVTDNCTTNYDTYKTTAFTESDIGTDKVVTVTYTDTHSQTKTGTFTITVTAAIDPTAEKYWGTGANAGYWGSDWVNAIQNLSDTELASLVGKTKTVSVNSISHKVRVIGYNHDALTTPTNTRTTAALTFEFADLISEEDSWSEYTSMTQAWHSDKTTCTQYLDSDMHAALTDSGTIGSLIKTENSDLWSAIKPVDKVVSIVPSGTIVSETTTITGEKLWLPSFTELGYTGGALPEEGSIYNFYSSGGSTIKSIIGSSSGTKYWTRSPYGYYTQYRYYTSCFVYPDGILQYLQVTSTESSIAPAFCI